MSENKIQIVFSDLDGTLIHYPITPPPPNDSLIHLPPSKTGKRGILSTKTKELCDTLRTNLKLIYVSGMRHTTLMKRIPFLPKADVYCCDNGGRIFIRNGDIIQEDVEWKNTILSYLNTQDYDSHTPLEERQGRLWDLAKELVEEGWVIDTAGYNTCFRVSFNDQDHTKKPIEMFENLSSVVKDNDFITSSVNLGCIDFYPTISGKKNWYVLFCPLV